MSETKDVRALIEQIDALLAINTSGNAVPRIPGLAVELLTRSRAALERAPKPAGGEWVTVPKEPTKEMCGAFWEAHEEYEDGGLDGPDHQWAAMISAAPPAPAASPSGGEVVVKALEWRSLSTPMYSQALVLGGPARYLANNLGYGWVLWSPGEEPASHKGMWFGAGKDYPQAFEKMRAAAQADFEQRILSNLISPEAPQASEVVRELMEALEPLAGLMDDETLKSWPKHRDRFPATTYSSNSIRIGDIRRARSALAKIGGDHE